MDEKQNSASRSHNGITLSDSISSFIWMNNENALYSVWHQPHVDLHKINGKHAQIECANYYNSMVFDRKSKVYMAAGELCHIDMLDQETETIVENFCNLDEPLASTLITRLILLKNNTILAGITKDPGYFFIDLRNNEIITQGKLPFNVYCHDYNREYETLVMGVRYKGKFSHIDINMQSLLKNEYKEGYLSSKVLKQIDDDEKMSPQEKISSIAISKSCRFIALGAKGKIFTYARSESEESNQLVSVIRAHTHDDPMNFLKPNIYNVNQVKFSPNCESLLVSAGGEGSIQFYNVEKKSLAGHMLYMKKKENEVNGFLDVGWNPEGTYMHYTKGYDSKFGDLDKDSRKNQIQNKLYFISWKEVFEKCSLKSLIS